jgi:hypothetical protein
MKRVLIVAMAVLGSIACSPANVASAPADAGAATSATLDAGDGGITVASACAESAFARCSQLEACSSSAVQFRYGNLTTCEALYRATCLAIMSAPSSGTTPPTAEACAAAISTWSCDDYLFNQNPPPECQRQAGQLANGSPCGLGQQCQSSFCSIVTGHMCGTCAPAPLSGDSCANLTDCGPSLTCIAASLKCEGYAQMGSPCTPGLPCAVGLACVGFNVQTSTAGTCQPEAIGGPCSFLGAGCDVFRGLSCNAQTQMCETASVVGAGAACGVVANQQAYCAASGLCVEGACQAAGGVGAPCDLVKGPFCINLARCVVDADGGTSGTCMIPSASTCL